MTSVPLSGKKYEECAGEMKRNLKVYESFFIHKIIGNTSSAE